jgi:hypothetical protein
VTSDEAFDWLTVALHYGEDDADLAIAESARCGRHQLARHLIEYRAGSWRILAA